VPPRGDLGLLTGLEAPNGMLLINWRPPTPTCRWRSSGTSGRNKKPNTWFGFSMQPIAQLILARPL
jgi:hypothetical protein